MGREKRAADAKGGGGGASPPRETARAHLARFVARLHVGVNVGIARDCQLRQVFDVGAKHRMLAHTEAVAAGRVEKVADLFVVNLQVADLNREFAGEKEKRIGKWGRE